MTSKQVPREKIPWYPTVLAEKCNGCRVCFEFCQQGVYAWDEQHNIAKVVRPSNCVVGCNGCENLCAPGAISFPELEAIQEIIRKIREE
jgi:NAD-dependent dihydropyrimidine dehydrogenase PreA subunit